MLDNIIRNSFVILIAIFTFYKLLNYKFSFTTVRILLICTSLIISIISGFFFISNQAFNWICILIAYIILMQIFLPLSWYVTYTTSLFAFSLSFISFILSGVVSSLILFPIYYNAYEVPWILIHLGAGIIQFLAIYFCFRIPRLQRGMMFLYHIPSGNIGSTLCILIFTFIIINGYLENYTKTFIFTYSAIIFIGLFLLSFWWNYHLTQTYRKYLKKNEITTLNNLILEKDAEIQRLQLEHDRLAHIIHKDNKLLPAFSLAITDFLKNKNNLSSAELETYGNNLRNQLELLYDERVKTVSERPTNLLPLPLTNICSVDAILSFMYKRALKENIPFQLILTDDISTISKNIISEKDLTLFLSELLENALYASQNISDTNIQVYLGMYNEIFTLKVSNVGVRFELDTLQNLGIVKHTSHQDTGGSGTGMMDIWMLKERYLATLIIDETYTDCETSVQTCISILFNRKNHYIIHSDRYKDLIKSINRPDVLILSKE